MAGYDDVVKLIAGEAQTASQRMNDEISPEDAARAFDLERSFGTPAQSVAQDLPAWEGFHRGELAHQILQNDPYLRDFVNSNPLHGPLIKNDLGGLAQFTQAYNGLVRSTSPVKEDGGFFARMWDKIKDQGLLGKGPSPAQTILGPAAEVTAPFLDRNEQGVIQLKSPAQVGYEALQAGAYTGLSKVLQQPWLPGGGVSENDAERIARHAVQYVDMLNAFFAGVLPTHPGFLESFPREGEVLPPEAPTPSPGGLPKPPPTLDLSAEAPKPANLNRTPEEQQFIQEYDQLTADKAAEERRKDLSVVQGGLSTSRRDFLKGLGAVVAKPVLDQADSAVKAMQAAPLERLRDPAIPQQLARQYAYMFGNEEAAAQHIFEDLLPDAGPRVRPALQKAYELLNSKQITAAQVYADHAANQMALQEQFSQAIKDGNKLRGFIEADERPPLGINDEIDKIHEEEMKSQQDQLGEIYRQMGGIRLPELSPQKFAEYLETLPKAMVNINIEAFDKLYGPGGTPEVGDNKLGKLPQEALAQLPDRPTNITVPLSAFLRAVPQEVYEAIKDNVSLGDGITKEEWDNYKDGKAEAAKAEELRPPPQLPETIRGAAIRLDGRVEEGPSHADALISMDPHGQLTDADLDRLESGFITDRNRFISRQEALTLERIPLPYVTDPSLGLTSEDLQAFRDLMKLSPLYIHSNKLPSPEVAKLWDMVQRGASIEEFKANPLVKNFLEGVKANEPTPTAEEVAKTADTFKYEDPVSHQEFTADQLAQRIVKEALARGTVDKGRNITFFLGPPGAGKSTAVEPFAAKTGAAMVSMDDFKPYVPSYAGGVGGMTAYSEAHHRAKVIEAKVMHLLQARGYNIANEKLGDNWQAILPIIEDWMEAGYTVHLAHVNAALEKRIPRIISRWLKSGRLIDLDYAASKQDTTLAGYNALKGEINGGYSAYDSTNTEPYQPPQLVEGAGTYVARGVGGGGGPPSGTPPQPSQPSVPPEGGPRPLFIKGKAVGQPQTVLNQIDRRIAQAVLSDNEWKAKNAIDKVERQNSKEFMDKFKERLPAKIKEIEEFPEVKAYRWFDEGKLNNKRKPKIKIDSMTEEQTRWMPERFMTRQGGLDINTAVNFLGYKSADDLVQDLSNMEYQAKGETTGSIVDRIAKAELVRELEAELGPTARERLDNAMEQAASPEQVNLLHESILKLGMELGTEAPISRDAMEIGAINRLNNKLYGGVSAKRIRRDITRFGNDILKASVKAEPDYPAIYRAMTAQFSSMLELKATENLEKLAKRFDRIRDKYENRNPTNREAETTNWIHDLLSRAQLSSRPRADIDTEIRASSRPTFQEFLDFKQDMGQDMYVAPQFVDPTYQIKPLKEMTVREARDFFNTIYSMDRASGKAMRFITKQGRIALDTTIEGMIKQLKDFNVDPKNLDAFNNGWATDLRKVGKTFLASGLRMDFVFNAWDKDDRFGPFSQWIFRPLKEAQDRSDALSKEYAEKFAALPGNISREDLAKPIKNTVFKDPGKAEFKNGKWDYTNAPLITGFTRKHLRGVILNIGNDSNLNKLAEGYGVTPTDILNWVNAYATKEDFDWAQGHGELFDGLKREADIVYRRLTGMAPVNVEIRPVETKFGIYKGWYHPIIYDPLYRSAAIGPSQPTADALLNSTYVRATTPNGYTKERQDVTSPMYLGLDMVTSQISQRIHDISYREAVSNAAKLIYNANFNRAVTQYMGKEYQELLKPWLKDIANSRNYDSAIQSMGERVINYMTQNIISNYVGWNTHTMQKHFLSALASSILEAGGDDFGKALNSLLNESVDGKNNNWNWAISKSPELQRRHRTFIEQVNAQYPRIVGEQSEFKNLRDAMLKVGTAPVAFFDMLSAVPTWLAVYNRRLQEFGPSRDSDAVYAADVAVSRAHGSTALPLRPSIMRNYPNISQLYNFMNRQLNYQWDLYFQATHSKVPDYKTNIGLGFFTNVFFPGFVDTFVSDLPKDFSPVELIRDSLITGLVAPWPIARDVWHAYRTGTDPQYGIMSEQAKSMTRFGQDVAKDQIRNNPGLAARDLLNLLSMLTGLGYGTTSNAAEFLINWQNGREIPKDIRDVYTGLTRGRTKQGKSRPDIPERIMDLFR